MKSQASTKGKGLREMLRKYGYEVYLLDEFKTSKTCNKCGSDLEECEDFERTSSRPWRKEKKEIPFGLRRCMNDGCYVRIKLQQRQMTQKYGYELFKTCISF